MSDFDRFLIENPADLGTFPAFRAHVVTRTPRKIPFSFDLTAHAKTVLAERRISELWIERVLNNPERTYGHVKDKALHHALGRISEYGDRVLHVVYNRDVTPIRVVTVYFDRTVRKLP